MSRARDALMTRRAALVARAAVQRDDLARQLGAWEPAFDRIDRAMAWLGRLRRHARPLAVGVAVLFAVLAARRPPSLTPWIRGGANAWRVGRTALGWIAALRA